MKIFKNFIGLAALALCLGFASCGSDDDAPSYSNVAVSNSELMTILKAKGYQFDENGKMLLDDKATSTTSLDLSGTKVDTAALKELSVFPNLKALNLSNNGYGPVFHIASLPSQITGLDLQGNDIYDFDGLVTAKVENDEVKATILHEFTKLYLPASCKYNVEDLMPFYTQNEAENKTVDMQMVNDMGSLEKYNTLREIPDTYFAAYLKMNFSSVFTSDGKLDISKPLGLEDRGRNIFLQYDTQYADIEKIASIEGIEYFVNNPFYESFYVYIDIQSSTEHIRQFECHRLSPRQNIKGLVVNNTNFVGGLDLNEATALSSLGISNNPSVTSLDLTNTAFLNQETKDFDATMSNFLDCRDCKNLEEIKINPNNKKVTSQIVLANLPKLKTINLQSIEGIGDLALCQLPNCDIVYPNNLIAYYRSSNNKLYYFESNPRRKVYFTVSQDVLNKESTKNFVQTYSAHLQEDNSTYSEYNPVNWN